MTDAQIHKPHEEKSRGVRFIATYKAAKGVLLIVLVCIIAAGLNERRLTALQEYIVHWHENLTAAWSNKLAVWLEANLVRSRLRIAMAALGADAVLSGVEAWALYKEKPWGEWLVVIATSGLVPFEIYEIFHKLTVTRVAVLMLNLAVVGYLARRQLTRSRALRQPTFDAKE